MKKKARSRLISARAGKKGSPAKASGVRSKGPVLPLGDRVLLRPLTQEETGTKSQFGIIIPDTVDKEKPEQGIVIAVGAGKRNDDGSRTPIEVAAGDRVVFSKYGYDEVKVGGKEYYLVSEANILAIINNQ
jgi:chaperonin GroES